MQLHCLGTVGFHPSDDRHTSCYFLPHSGIVLDAGTGTFRLPELIETETLDVLLSHAHLDHVFGLTALLEVRVQRPLRRIRVWGERQKLSAVRRHLFDPLLFPVELDAEWMEIDAISELRIGAVRVGWRPQQHPGGSVAYRLDWDSGESLVYATDTSGDTSAEYAAWAGGVDLLMHECNFRDAERSWAEKTGHSWTSRLVEVAAACQPKSLLVTHLNPLERADDPVDLAAIRRQLDASVTLAEDGLCVDF